MRLLCLRETPPDRVHDTRIADPTPEPQPAGRQRRHDLGVQACTRAGVEILPPAKKPHGKAVPRAQTAGNRKRTRRRVRLAHVHRRGKRGRMRQETSRLWQDGIRDKVMEIGWARHHVRVRLTPSWTPLASIVMNSIERVWTTCLYRSSHLTSDYS